MMTARKLIVLGSGPVGLMAAIFARRNDLEVEVVSSVWPSPIDAATIESVPGQTMALLVETGLHPRSLGVRQVFSEQVRQWGTSLPSRKITTGRVHVSRPELDVALFELAERLGAIFTTQRVDRNRAAEYARDGVLLYDASGRSALTASAVFKPRRPIVGRQWLFETDGKGVATFGIAAVESGYFYRMGNARRICVGVVGDGSLLRGDWSEIRAQLAARAEWFVDGLAEDFAEVGRSGATTMQWASGSREARQLGDASLAQDALSSQGLAAGLTEAVQTVLADLGRPVSLSPRDRKLTITGQRALVAEIVATSPFARDPLWSEYLAFLHGADESTDTGRDGADMHREARSVELAGI